MLSCLGLSVSLWWGAMSSTVFYQVQIKCSRLTGSLRALLLPSTVKFYVNRGHILQQDMIVCPSR